MYWWAAWGKDVPELQKLAMLIVPLLAGSGPAERTWKDIGHILTKERRGKMLHANMVKILFVRRWLRRKYNRDRAEEAAFKEWEEELSTLG